MAQTKKTTTAGRRPKTAGTDVDTRAAILTAAREVFARRGFAGTSVREVAEEAKVNKAMIYYHFDDKVDLYRAVLSHSFAAMDRIWDQEIFKNDSPAQEKIQTYIKGFIRFQQKNEDLRKILAMEFSRTGAKSDNMKWIAKQYFAKNHASLMNILKAGMNSGELRKADPLLAVVSLIGIISHIFIYIPIAPYIQKKSVDLSVLKLSSFVTELYFNGLSVQKIVRKRIRRTEVRS